MQTGLLIMTFSIIHLTANTTGEKKHTNNGVSKYWKEQKSENELKSPDLKGYRKGMEKNTIEQ